MPNVADRRRPFIGSSFLLVSGVVLLQVSGLFQGERPAVETINVGPEIPFQGGRVYVFATAADAERDSFEFEFRTVPACSFLYSSGWGAVDGTRLVDSTGKLLFDSLGGLLEDVRDPNDWLTDSNGWYRSPNGTFGFLAPKDVDWVRVDVRIVKRSRFGEKQSAVASREIRLDTDHPWIAAEPLAPIEVIKKAPVEHSSSNSDQGDMQYWASNVFDIAAKRSSLDDLIAREASLDTLARKSTGVANKAEDLLGSDSEMGINVLEKRMQSFFAKIAQNATLRVDRDERASPIMGLGFVPGTTKLCIKPRSYPCVFCDIASGNIERIEDCPFRTSYSPCGRFRLEDRFDGSHLIEMESNKEVGVLKTRMSDGLENTDVGQFGAAFSLDGNLIAKIDCERKGFLVWTTESLEQIANEKCYQIVEHLEICDRGKAVLLQCSGNAGEATLKLFSLQENKWLDHPCTRTIGVSSFTCSPEGNFLAVGIKGKETPSAVHIWKMSEEQRFRIIELGGRAGPILFSWDGSILAIAESYGVWLWQMPDCRFIKLLTFGNNIQHLAMDQDCSVLAAAGGSNDDTVRVWKVPGRESKFKQEIE